jgi:hypothetical protein
MSNLEMYIDSEIEYGLRALILISELDDIDLSFEKLLIYDYMLTNFKDFDNSFESVNPDTSYRFSKLVVKRQAYKDGLNYCVIKNLIDINFSPKGILYTKTSLTSIFISHMSTPYIDKLKQCANIIHDVFGSVGFEELQKLIENKILEQGISFRAIKG